MSSSRQVDVVNTPNLNSYFLDNMVDHICVFRFEFDESENTKHDTPATLYTLFGQSTSICHDKHIKPRLRLML